MSQLPLYSPAIPLRFRCAFPCNSAASATSGKRIQVLDLESHFSDPAAYLQPKKDVFRCRQGNFVGPPSPGRLGSAKKA
jgi:hypothetical protein